MIGGLIVGVMHAVMLTVSDIELVRVVIVDDMRGCRNMDRGGD